mmetsp:Transcript_32262/g.86387  ORF Transcript_32262/g.86387 Transcript_32262/m.86387 type:complete len:236 (-) Transcript_32262:604-1311(-)
MQGDHIRVAQRGYNASVVSSGIQATPQRPRKQIVRRSTEPKAHAEQLFASELLTGRGQVVFVAIDGVHVWLEDVVVEQVLDRRSRVGQDAGDELGLFSIVQIQQLQRPNMHLRIFVSIKVLCLVSPSPCLLSFPLIFFLQVADPYAFLGEASHPAACTSDHVHVCPAPRAPMVLDSGLHLHLIREQSQEALHIGGSQPCQSIGHDGHANRHVRVAELRQLAWQILPHKRHSQQSA